MCLVSWQPATWMLSEMVGASADVSPEEAAAEAAGDLSSLTSTGAASSVFSAASSPPPLFFPPFLPMIVEPDDESSVAACVAVVAACCGASYVTAHIYNHPVLKGRRCLAMHPRFPFRLLHRQGRTPSAASPVCLQQSHGMTICKDTRTDAHRLTGTLWSLRRVAACVGPFVSATFYPPCAERHPVRQCGVRCCTGVGATRFAVVPTLSRVVECVGVREDVSEVLVIRRLVLDRG